MTTFTRPLVGEKCGLYAGRGLAWIIVKESRVKYSQRGVDIRASVTLCFSLVTPVKELAAITSSGTLTRYLYQGSGPGRNANKFYDFRSEFHV